MDLKREAERFADRSYTIQVNRDLTTDDLPVYLAISPELEGCMGQGKSVEEAINNLREARIDYIQSLLEDQLPIPEPQTYPTSTTSGTTATFTRSSGQSNQLTILKSDPDTYSVTHLVGISIG